MAGMVTTMTGIGFLFAFGLALMGIYYWLFGASKVREDDGRP
jgi:hypothetical protein